jgi:hypothetical protein
MKKWIAVLGVIPRGCLPHDYVHPQPFDTADEAWQWLSDEGYSKCPYGNGWPPVRVKDYLFQVGYVTVRDRTKAHDGSPV